MEQLQRIESWYEKRKGKFTASEIIKILGVRGLGETGKSYAIDKAIEQLFGEFEENVRDGKIHKIIELYYAITMKKIDSGEVQRNIDETLKKLLESVNKMTDANPNTNKDINKDRRDNNDNNDDNPNKRRK